MDFIIFAVVCSVFVTLLIVFALPPLIFNIRKNFGLHAWSYRNPHDRTCIKCDRREVEHRYAWQPNSMGFWEVFKDGNGRSIICRKNQKTVTNETEAAYE